MRIIGTKITIRELTFKDSKDFYEFGRNPNIGPMAGWKPFPNYDVACRMLSSLILNKETYAITEIDSNKLEMTGPMIALKKIQVCKQLKYLSYQNMTILPFFVDLIIQALNANPSIEKINLKQNIFKEEELKKFVNATSNAKIIFSKDKLPSNAMEIIGGNKNIIVQ